MAIERAGACVCTRSRGELRGRGAADHRHDGCNGPRAMRHRTTRFTNLALALATAIAVPASAAAGNRTASQTQLKPNDTRYVKPSERVPPRARVNGKVTTWDVRRRPAP